MTKPAPTFDIKVNGVDREILMSFGLLDQLSRIVEAPDNVGQVLLAPDLRQKVMVEVLAERKPSGKIIKAIDDFEDLDIEIDAAEALLDWSMEHLMDFFVRRLQKVADISLKNQERMNQVVSSLAGSEV